MKHRQIQKNKGLIYQYPRIFIGVTTTAALLILFSRPIYDAFFNTYQPTLETYERERQLMREKRK